MEGDECWVQCDMCQKWRAISPTEMIGVAVGQNDHDKVASDVASVVMASETMGDES